MRRPKQREQNNKRARVALLLCCSIFSKEIFGISVLGSVIDVYQLSLALWGCLLLGNSRSGLKVLIFGLILLATSSGLLFFHGFEIDILLKQGIPGVIVFTGFCVLIEKTTPGCLLAAYRKVCLWVALFGLFQFVFSLGGVALLIKVQGRLDSLTYEASHYAVAIGPAVYLALREMLKSQRLWNWKCWILIVSLLLTVSLTSIFIILACITVLRSSWLGSVFSLAVMALGFWLYVNQQVLPAEIRDRIEALEGAADADTHVDEISNLSVLSPASNGEVAKDTLLRGRLLGNGFGGHQYAYYEYFKGSTFSLNDRFGTNAISGHSLFIRVISEFGLLGLLTYIWWVAYGLLKDHGGRGVWWTLFAIYLIGRVIKLGGVFELGLPLFALAPFIFYRWAPGGRRKIRRSSENEIRPKGCIKKSSLARI